MNYKDFFKGKKITVMGLGLIGKGAINPAFLAECKAEVIATDLKSEEELRPTIEKLKAYTNITFHLGGHRFEDFENVDFVLKNQGVPLDSPYIAHARESGVPVEMDESLFAKIAPEVVLVGVTGTRGKSTTATLIYEIIKGSGRNVFLSGNLPGKAVLPLLNEVRSGDLIVLELSSWQLQGFDEAKISPHVAVFTTFLDDHLNYYKGDRARYYADKSAIYRYQKAGDFLVVGDQVASMVDTDGKPKSKVVVAGAATVPKEWRVRIPGEHNLLNISCAVAACRALGIPDDDIKRGVESFVGIEGRLQFVTEVKGIKIYNDNNATTPDATIVALKAFKGTPTILIAGGADKGLDLRALEEEMLQCKKVILLPGSGSDRLTVASEKVSSLKEALEKARSIASTGDTILFSPAFASFGLYNNEYERNDEFLRLVRA